MKALRPLDVDCGPVQRAPQGYRVHTSMIRFSWSGDSVTDKIRALEHAAERAKAREAYDFLMQHEGSAYGKFVERHQEFRQRHPNPTAAELRRPLQFIEELGLECALWPDLYTDLTACETYERATDTRRQQRHPDVDDAESEDSSQSVGDTASRGASCSRRWGPSWIMLQITSSCSSCLTSRSGPTSVASGMCARTRRCASSSRDVPSRRLTGLFVTQLFSTFNARACGRWSSRPGHRTSGAGLSCVFECSVRL